MSAKDCEAWFRFVSEMAADLSHGKIVFPTSFETTFKLRELLRSENAGAAEITRAVSVDPLLSARLVQVANSAAFARDGRKVSDLRAAVVRLGLVQVRNLATAVAMAQMVTYRQMLPYRKLGQQMLAHSRWVAAVSVVLAREHSSMEAGTAFFCGLIHDIGVFYLLYRLAERPEFFDGEDELNALLHDWHGQIGHALLATLDVPEDVQQAVADHDEPRTVRGLVQLADLLYVANLMAQHEPRASAPIAGEVATRTDHGVEQLDSYRATVNAARDEILELTRAFA